MVILETNVYLSAENNWFHLTMNKIKVENSYNYYFNHETPICLRLKCRNVIA